MHLSNLPISTLKETPADAEVASHRLMLRAGLIRKLASGLYTWLPIGVRVLRKVEEIVRSEMNAIGALEVLMPCVQPAELWQESQRWDKYGVELLRFKDRHKRDFCFGPTHEEVITDIARRELRSYKQVPATFYQIQTKFRDEIRPRFGVMRAREFIMKDAYSFHLDEESLNATYRDMYGAYSRILDRLGLRYRAVLADSGAIGGAVSHEFHVLAASGEDAIAYSDESDYAANTELAEALAPPERRPAPGAEMATQATPGKRTIEEVTQFLDVPTRHCIKTLMVKGSDAAGSEVVALALRGDHELNMIKAEKLAQVAAPITLADAETVRRVAGCEPGYIGPVGLDCSVLADRAALAVADFVCGANRDDEHLVNVNWARDTDEPESVDIRNVVAGDPSPDGRGTLLIDRGIEVGHIFQLGRVYSTPLGAQVLDADGRMRDLTMGCYGIGITRMVAAAIEQNHDDKGIAWPDAIAPFQIAIVPLNVKKSIRVREAAEKLYGDLVTAGYEVLIDDRDARPGFKFSDIELIGIPHRLVIAEKAMDRGVIEYRGRRDDAAQDVELTDLMPFLASKIGSLS